MPDLFSDFRRLGAPLNADDADDADDDDDGDDVAIAVDIFFVLCANKQANKQYASK